MESYSLIKFLNSKVVLLFTLALILVTMNQCYSNKSIENLIISEFMADNDSFHKDSIGGFRDWVEMQNLSDKPLQLNNFFISNDRNDLLKTRLPNIELLPNEFIVFSATSNDSIANNLGFKLNKKSGELFLTLADGQTIIDEVQYRTQFTDISYSRLNEEWVFNEYPTPNLKNSNEGYYTSLSGDLSISFQKDVDRVQATLETEYEGAIKYTLDGSSPFNADALTYSQPFEVDSSAVVRAIIQGKYVLDHNEKRGVYVDSSKHTLPIISIITDSTNLWDPEVGIFVLGKDKNYTRRGEEWNRPGYIGFNGFSDQLISTEMNFKIYGSGTRIRPKKSITVLFDDGIKNLFFHSFDESEMDGFVLRACYSDASRYKNELVYQVNEIMKSKMLMQEYRPVVVYINGRYWGLYNLSERKNSDFIGRHHDEKPKYIHNANARSVKVVKGKTIKYSKLLDSLNSMDMNDDSVFDFIQEEFDLESILDFAVQESYTNKPDRFNNRFWKAKGDSSKWHYVGYDYDVGFAAASNNRIYRQLNDTVAQGISIVGRLMLNKEFQTAYFERMCDYLNFGYTEQNVAAILKEVDSLVYDEFKLDYLRWKPEFDRCLDQPENQKKNILKYIVPRKEFVLNEVASGYGFIDKIEFIVPDTLKGKVKINNHFVVSQATYFTNMVLDINIVPDEGYEFVGWENGFEKWKTNGVYVFEKPISLTPVFKLK